MPPRQSRPRTPTQVDALKHQDKRANIPTAELSDFVAADEESPKKLLYPRDPSLDPQLVWKGKDEQDRQDLEVPLVPIYIQEKIQPRAIIEEVKRQAKAGTEQQAALNLFADFNGIEFDRLVEFYQHEQNWSNRMVLGDSLMVMASLAEKEGLKGKVQMIYIDPPYGIRFGSNWQPSTRKREVGDGNADLSREPEVVKAFRDTWSGGIHSYLSYLRDRLVSAHELLSDSGSIFVQISDENVHLVRALLDEVFGQENFVVTVNLKKKGNQKGSGLESITDYILLYAKVKAVQKYRPLFLSRTLSDDGFVADQLTSGGLRRNQNYDFVFQGKVYRPAPGNCWKILEDGMRRVELAGRLVVGRGQIRFKKLDADFGYTTLTNNWEDTGGASDLTYVVQTAGKVIERCLLLTTDPGDLVLDPTCGSGTTAYVAEQWGRRWITIDTSRVALALARTRLMSARYPYYLLADTPEGGGKEAEVRVQAPPATLPDGGDVRKGFVYKRVSHVMLSSIANNPDIREGMTRDEIDAAIARHAETELLYDQPYEDNRRVRVTGPFTVESLPPHRILSEDADRTAGEAEAQERTASADFATMIIENLKKAGVQNTRKDERLKFDRLEPYANPWIHAAGEFTDKGGLTRRVAVSIGPEYGTVSPEQVKEAAKEALKGRGFDLLVVCGLAFDAHAGETAKEFQPEPKPGRDDGSFAVAEEQRQYGKLPVLLARINPDLTMGVAGEELLKKTGAGNLFMVFGEPDIEIRRVSAPDGGRDPSPSSPRPPSPPRSAQDDNKEAPQPGPGGNENDGKLVVEIHGLDVYDPTTGQIRSSSTDDIACWFIDTAYNGESFFVRHAYFTGAGDPYDRLKRALRAEIDEGAWSQLYSTRSFPFDRPTSGKIAVKVINHYGDEVLKVYEV